MMLTKDDDCMAYGWLQRADLDATAVPLKLPTKSSSDDEEGDPESGFLILIMILMIIMRIKDDKEDADGNATCSIATSWSRSIQALVC